MRKCHGGRSAVMWMWMLLALHLSTIDASHFRGASIMLQPTNSGIDKEMDIFIQISWKRNSFEGDYCDEQLVNSGNIIGSGTIKCQSGCSGDVAPAKYQCTGFSIVDNWSYGGKHYVYQFNQADDQIRIGYEGYLWVAPFESKWNVATSMSLSKRNDTGKINSTPRAIVMPVISLQEGCNHSIAIDVSDPDGDQVRCRWAVGYNECGKACNAFPEAVLHKNSCTVSYEAVHGTGYKIAAVMIEDFLPESDIPLSSVSLQFLVDVYSLAAGNCSAKPEFVPPTLPSGSCLVIPPDTTYSDQLIVYSGGQDLEVIEIQTMSPVGLSKSPISSGFGPSHFYVNITWKPEDGQLNQTHSFCFTAVNSLRISSEQTCIQYMAGAYLPSVIQMTISPIQNERVPPAEFTLGVMFDQPVQRPSLEANILFRDYETNDVLYIISSLNSNEISFVSETTVDITPNHTFPEETKIFVELESSVVVGRNGCNPESMSLTDKDYFNFIAKNTTEENSNHGIKQGSKKCPFMKVSNLVKILLS